MATDDTKRYRDKLRDELEGAALYTALAAAEPDPIRKDLFVTYGAGAALGVSLS
jgi:vacuolar iron transporter family protein